MFELFKRDKRQVLEPEDVYHFESGYQHMDLAAEAMRVAASQVGELDIDLGERAYKLAQRAHQLQIDFRAAYQRAEQDGEY
ncbi:hypothetical protein C8K30_110114 [Promicromonospora sp. AC04]|uniref:hypothetical protein n=1 Tax=Promicromonospora sp. AC04 TaxID=2135723 RepID=UPI000D33CE58|nr:hypothetical protein [Promicromonospora sp. AC04]PUB23971.1 hypothetical protein C8K30_110114 [Promicromonospora sp. AC04]